MMPGGRLARVRFAPDVVLQIIGDEALVLKLGEESVLSLNSTAARIAQLIAQRLDAAAIADRLAEEYGSDPLRILADVEVLVNSLLDRGVLVRDDGGAI
jgi:hypothetical protein